MPLHGSANQRYPAISILRVDGRALVEELPHNCVMPFSAARTSAIRPYLSFASTAAPLSRSCRNCVMPLLGSANQRCPAPTILRVDGRTLVEELPHNSLIPLLGSANQQYPAIFILRIDSHALVEELPHNCLMPLHDSANQRCPAIFILRIDSRALVEELPHNCLMPLPRYI
ncbi:hypothetical protein NEMBOFW57_008145 [Staphylotrichum longicolle]|uniref:Uncharacterized protein n=1 Tax=Staphylotrichum longicolle TaxID=669026 RepID=A0AAD4EQQ9_9PEZI|nr:hypothetical protein NEMBOFW57_008145 [Staphylotrichum longicolle]